MSWSVVLESVLKPHCMVGIQKIFSLMNRATPFWPLRSAKLHFPACSGQGLAPSCRLPCPIAGGGNGSHRSGGFLGPPWWLFFLLLPMLLMPEMYKQAKARKEVMTLLLFMCLSNKRTKKPLFVETIFWFSFRTFVSTDALCRDAAFSEPRSSKWMEIQLPEFLPAGQSTVRWPGFLGVVVPTLMERSNIYALGFAKKFWNHSLTYCRALLLHQPKVTINWTC